MREELLYDPVGEWLIREKGCQRDELCLGYIKDSELVPGTRLDVIGCRYELIEEDRTYPVVHFHGYAVEVKGAAEQRELACALGQLLIAMQKFLYTYAHVAPFHTIRFYLAYPTEVVDKELRRAAEELGIGILALQVVEEEPLRVHVYEVLEAEEQVEKHDRRYAVGVPHARMRSRGVFAEAVRERPCLLKLLRGNPEKVFDVLLRPGIREYKKALEWGRIVSWVESEEARDALLKLLDEIKKRFPQLEELPTRYGLYIVPKGARGMDEAVLIIRTTRKYFYVDLVGSDVSYRIYSEDSILEFVGGSDKEYEGDLSTLIEEVLVSWIRRTLAGT